MRKAYRFLAAALSLVLCTGMQSCHNEKISSGYPILFRCADVTRAEATIKDLQDNGFNVNAYFTANGSKFDFTKSLSYDDVSGIWGYDDIEYWLPGATYYFKALYPTNAGTIDNKTSAQSLTISNFDVTSQTDLLVAETEAIVVDASIGSPTGGSVVNLTFQHLLANVVIKALSEINTPISVERIELRDISVGADYNGRSWNSSTPKGTYGINSNMQLTKATSDTDFKDITNGGLLVIPEQINGTQKLYVKTSFKEYEIAFPTIYSWNSGQRYTYTLVIKQENIEFNEPKVEIWDEENATGSVVIK